mmetsp:Transcript_13961/g.30176  ORF Transcript_13961/g.30176 Transcript_13961/m.30176 type:complete len:538 (+) Transcript_13961:56-1669(+)
MQQRMACNLRRTLCLKPFGTRNRSTVSVKAAKTSVIRTIQHDLQNKKRSAVEVTQHYLDSIARNDPVLNAFITVNQEQALAHAKELDAKIAKDGTSGLGPLAGVPIAIKDNICTQGIRTTAGSQILKDYSPAYDATAAARLRKSGAVFIGKTNMDEFGMGSSTENSSYKPTKNPWDPERVPGGSSGGSAAAVAGGECAAALGTDTGGSIRQPAHFCGVVGLKPTYGRVSRSGLISYASSLDVIGPMASCVEDAALLLNIIAGPDSADATCSDREVPDFSAGLRPASSLGSKPLAGKRLALVVETLGQGVAPEVEAGVRAAAKAMEELGAVVEEVSLPNFGVGLPAYYVLALSEASSNLSRYDGVRYGARDGQAADLASMYGRSRDAGLGAEVKRRILMGTYALSAGYYDAYYKRAQQVRTLVRQDMSNALSSYDALITPAAPTPAYKLGEKSSDPLSMYKGDLMTVNVNLAGLPAVVLPCGHAAVQGAPRGGLPLGVQLVGRAFAEAELLQLAHVYEQCVEVALPAGGAEPALAGAR